MKTKPLQPEAISDKGGCLEAASRLQRYHWLIFGLSLVLSFSAWLYVSKAQRTLVQGRFDRETQRTIELVSERLSKYEDALWSGVAMISAQGGDISHQQWQDYADSIHIEAKYPGVLGIGVIHALDQNSAAAHVQQQRVARPNFTIHPPHENELRFPISYITPAESNRKAIGLDIAHEQNRLAAALKARDTGQSNITAPIVLVQDNSKLPGFLFFAPFFHPPAPRDSDVDADTRRESFKGMVYAPFIVADLMRGALAKSKRQNSIRLSDGDTVLYDEHSADDPDFDSDPMLTFDCEIEMYGRPWTFQIWSSKSFREDSQTSESWLVLAGGIMIDLLLLGLFMSMSRSSRLAVNRARDLKRNQTQIIAWSRKLEQSNGDLEQFASAASHDLQEPLRKVATYCQMLERNYADKLDEEGQQFIAHAVDGAKRMSALIKNLLDFARINSLESQPTIVDPNHAIETALLNLESSIEESCATITFDDLPQVEVVEARLTQLFQNLIGNALKYRSDVPPLIHISVDADDREREFIFRVADNGIGIAPEHHQRVFGIFKRLHGRSKYSGTGIGLAICQRIVEIWNGRIWIEPKIESSDEPGSTFCFSIPVVAEVQDFTSQRPLEVTEV